MLAIIAAASIVLGSHVRSEDPVIGAALKDGLLNSAVVQRLVDVIDASNVVVYADDVGVGQHHLVVRHWAGRYG